MNDVEKLHAFLKKAQEPKGFYLSNNRSMVFDLLEGLLDNKSRYGYMGCPCRLASGDRERTGILFALAITGKRMSKNTGAAIATCMFQRTGMRGKLSTNMFPRVDPLPFENQRPNQKQLAWKGISYVCPRFTG